MCFSVFSHLLKEKFPKAEVYENTTLYGLRNPKPDYHYIEIVFSPKLTIHITDTYTNILKYFNITGKE